MLPTNVLLPSSVIHSSQLILNPINIYGTNSGQLWRKLFKKAYDVRGKKQRYADFNSKFVAVRGKKNSLDQEDNDLEQNSVQPWVYLIGSKRAPNGFVGMRGKRPGRRKNRWQTG